MDGGQVKLLLASSLVTGLSNHDAAAHPRSCTLEAAAHHLRCTWQPATAGCRHLLIQRCMAGPNSTTLAPASVAMPMPMPGAAALLALPPCALHMRAPPRLGG